MCLGSLKPVELELHIGFLPRERELAVDHGSGLTFVLRTQRGCQPEERPPVARKLGEIGAELLLGFGRLTVGQQRGGERLTGGVPPERRFHVRQRMFGFDRLTQKSDALLAISARGGDTRVSEMTRDDQRG